MSENKQNQSVILYISIGMLIPILVALIPYGHKYLFPEHDLNYSILSKTKVDDFSAISIEIQNGGEKSEKNIEVSLKKNQYLFREGRENKLVSVFDVDPEISHKITEDSKSFVITLANLRPSEKVKLSILSDEFTIADYEKNLVEVRTEESIARLNEPSEFLQFFYPFSFWMFIVLMVLGFLTGIYQEYFENPKSRENRLLKEIDKLKK